MKNPLSPLLAGVAAALLLGACATEANELRGRRNGDAPENETTPGDDPGTPDGSDPAQCTSREHVGLGGESLVKDRAVVPAGQDRGRVKPFGALATEYARVLGKAPASLAGAGATFGNPPARWYDEPQANAVALQTAYGIAFDGCLDFTASAPDYATAPDTTTATDRCATMARAFWSRTPTPQEIEACVAVATTGATTETNPRRKWAYACASVLTAAGFLTY